MGHGRTVAASLAVALLVGFTGACGSDGSSKAHTQQQRAAAHARAVARQARQARQRRLVRQRTVARRRARAAAARQQARQVRLTRLRRARASNPARDLAALRRSVQLLNGAFHKSVAHGIARSAALNYWVATGVYDPAACVAFESDAGGGVVAETLVLHPLTFRATPGWVDPAVGRLPGGRLYAVGVDEIQTLVPTGERRTQQHDLHASVDGAGHAHLFFRCA